jgi:hypothetical protein
MTPIKEMGRFFMVNRQTVNNMIALDHNIQSLNDKVHELAFISTYQK